MKRIVIAGATSFIGTSVAEAAADRGWQITAVVRRKSNKTDELKKICGIKLVEMNLDEYSAIGNEVGNADVYVHLTWSGVRGAERNNEELQKANYEHGTAAVESILKAGCRKIIIAGSQAEYGLADGVITEDTPCNPNTAYGKYKYAMYCKTSELCKKYNAEYYEARIFSVYGPHDDKSSLIMSLISNMKKNEPCKMTECTQMWDFLYVKDAADAVMRLAESKCPCGAYNVASGDIRALKEYVKELYSILGSKSELMFGVIPYPAAGAVSIRPSVTKIREYTGWKAVTGFSEGIKAIIE